MPVLEQIWSRFDVKHFALSTPALRLNLFQDRQLDIKLHLGDMHSWLLVCTW